jgi:glycosyltransferase involved in cell wall biosynthesis
MIKVLGFAIYGPLAASTRYRLGQYVAGLARLGIDLHIRHLLGDSYLRAQFNGTALPIGAMVVDGLRRMADLWQLEKYDAAMVHCELIPMMPGLLERAMLCRPYVYDFDDAFYLRYRIGRMRMASPILGTKFDTFMAGASAVTAGNHILDGYAKQYNANTYYLPTVVDANRYVPEKANRGSSVFTVGWIGSPSTAVYLGGLVAPLAALGLEGAVRLMVIGGVAPKIPNVTVIELEWNETTELDLINSFDVGVMPLPDDEWARGKCAFKLIQYMACAVPVIASPVGANVDVVTSECGLLAASEQEWLDALRLLRDQPRMRAHAGMAARQRVIEHYSLEKNVPVLGAVLHGAAKG